MVTILGGGFPNIEPIRSTKVARISLTDGPRRADALLMSFDLIECGKQGPGS